MNYDDLIDSLHIAEPTRELCIKAADAIQQMIIDRNAFKDIAQKRADVIERMQKELHEGLFALMMVMSFLLPGKPQDIMDLM